MYSVDIGVPFTSMFAWWGSDKKSVAAVSGARMVDRRKLANKMREAAGAVAQILNCEAHIEITRNTNVWNIAYRDHQGSIQYLIAKNVCDATGRRSAVARSIGARRKAFDNLCCVSIPVRGSAEIGSFTEATTNGWWNLCNDEARGTLSFYSKSTFIKSASQNLIHLFNETKEIQKLTSFEDGYKVSVNVCGSSILSPCAGAGWFAVGDAAATFQPLTSTGVAKALRDAQNVHKAISDASGYDHQYQVEFQHYLQNLKTQYDLEKRWNGSEFWK